MESGRCKRRTRQYAGINSHGSRISSAPADPALTKQSVLDSGAWLDATQTIHWGISREEQAEAWLRHPTRIAEAADWMCYLDTDYHYRRFALHAHAQGWCVFPETNGIDGERKPAAAPPRWMLKQNRRGDISAWHKSYNPAELCRWAVKTSLRRDNGISAAELVGEIDCVDQWDNVGIVIGPASGNVRVLDIDVVDAELAQAIRDLAGKILGVTPFVRIGRAPKAQLVFRVAEQQMLDLPSKSWSFFDAMGKPDLDEEGKPCNAIEWLGYGRHFTCYGLHHKTHRSFDWSEGSLHPAIAGPEHAPVVTSKQFKQFMSDLAKLRKYVARGGSASNPFGNGDGETTEFEAAPSDARVWVPKTVKGAWTTDADGIVTDGREDYLRYLSYAFAAANAQLMLDDADAAAVLHAFIAFAQRTCAGGMVQGNPVEGSCRTKWRAVRKKWLASLRAFEREGKYHSKFTPFRIDPASGRRPCAQHIKPSQRPKDGSLDWLPAATSIIPELADRSKIKGVVAVSKSAAAIRSDREIRALIEDEAARAINHAKASGEVKAALQKFLNEVAAAEVDGWDTVLPVHILMAPTGGGKTTMTIGELAAWLKANPRRPGQGPVLIAVPTHANAEEALKVADRNGMSVPDDVEVDERKLAKDLATLRGAGLIAEVFKGKEKAGCSRMEELMALISKGINASKLCGTDVDDEDEIIAKAKRRNGEKVAKKEILCPVREAGECGYWKQHDKCAQAHVVFVPHAYLTTPKVPKVLSKPRLIIIDESIVFRLLHTILMPVAALENGRPEPWLTKREKDAGLKADEQRHMHEVACHEALKVLSGGKDVAAHLYGLEIGKALIDAAILVCKRAHVGERDKAPLCIQSN